MQSEPIILRPPQVTRAAILLGLSAMLRIVSFFVRHGPQQNVLANVTWAGHTGMLVLFAILFLRGSNMARWIYTIVVIAGLFLLPRMFERAVSRDTFSILYVCAQSALQIGAMFFLLSKSASAWFKVKNDAKRKNAKRTAA